MTFRVFRWPKCRTETCGAQRVDGRRPASASLTDPPSRDGCRGNAAASWAGSGAGEEVLPLACTASNT